MTMLLLRQWGRIQIEGGGVGADLPGEFGFWIYFLFRF